MKLIIAATLAATTFAPYQVTHSSNALPAFLDGLVEALEPTNSRPLSGLRRRPPMSLSMSSYHEAELAYRSIAKLAVVGFLVREKAEGSVLLFDTSISGPAIIHATQVPGRFWHLET